MSMVKPKCGVLTKHRFSPRPVVQLAAGIGIQCCSRSGLEPPSEGKAESLLKPSEDTMSVVTGASVSTQCETHSAVNERKEGKRTTVEPAPVVSPDVFEDVPSNSDRDRLYVHLDLDQHKRVVVSTGMDSEDTEQWESLNNVSSSHLDPLESSQISRSKEREPSVHKSFLKGNASMSKSLISHKPIGCSTLPGKYVKSHQSNREFPASKWDMSTSEFQSTKELQCSSENKYPQCSEIVPKQKCKFQPGDKRSAECDIEGRPTKVRKSNHSEDDSFEDSEDELSFQVRKSVRTQANNREFIPEPGEKTLVDYLKQLDDISSEGESLVSFCGGSIGGFVPGVCGSGSGLSGTDDSGLGLRAEADDRGLVDYSSSSEDESCEEFKQRPVTQRKGQNLNSFSNLSDHKLFSVNDSNQPLHQVKNQHLKHADEASLKSVDSGLPGKADIPQHLSVENPLQNNVSKSIFDHFGEASCRKAEFSRDGTDYDDDGDDDTSHRVIASVEKHGDLTSISVEEICANHIDELGVNHVDIVSSSQSDKQYVSSSQQATVEHGSKSKHNILDVSVKDGDSQDANVKEQVVVQSSPKQENRNMRRKGVSTAGEELQPRGLRRQPKKTQLFQAGLDQSVCGELDKVKKNQSPPGRVVYVNTRSQRDVSSDISADARSLRDLSAKPDSRSPRGGTINCSNRQGKKESTGHTDSRAHTDFAILTSSVAERKNGDTRSSGVKSGSDGRSSSTRRKSECGARSKQPEAVVLETEEDLYRVVELEPNLGRLVWARLCGGRWWPGMVVKGTMIYLQSERNNSSWIYWFGDHKVSQISQEKIIPFAENYSSKIGNFKSKLYRTAVMEALQESNRRSGEHIDHDELLHWAESGFKSTLSGGIVSLEPVEDKPVPDSVKGHLMQIGEEIRRKSAYVDYDKDDLDTERENAVSAVRKGEKQLNDVCIACADADQKVAVEHPLFQGGLCGQCQTEVAETMYAEGDDGLHSFCAVCGAGGDLFVCDAPECKRVYCRPCVEELGGDSVLKQVIEASKWQCFMCSPYTDQSDCLLHPRSDWQQRVILFFDTGYRVQVPTLDYFALKRPLRVLSLFDGIGSGKLALDQLGLRLDVYYASEIDPDALVVTRCNHGNRIIPLGDVTKLEDKQLSELVPIDLLIGGSPCNDLSLANPGRKGFEFGSTGLLAFDFVRVRNKLQALNVDTHLFWLYENVASMKTQFKNTLSRFLECQPALWDAKYMSAQRRGRYFWGNIPGLYSTPAISTHMHEEVNLTSVLQTGCERRATVEKMRCVTTRTNSLKHGKHDELFPVEMAGEASGIWISEVERLFGFPTHYTDVGNLPVTRRQKLLGRSWNIPIVKQILSPLMRYFATDNDPSPPATSACGESQVSSEKRQSNTQTGDCSSEQNSTCGLGPVKTVSQALENSLVEE